MPFIPVSRAMAQRRAERRKTLQGFEVKELGSRFQAAQRTAEQQFQTEQQGLASQYQQQLETYGKQMGQYEQKAREFQSKSDAYNEAVNRFNTLTALPGVFSALPIGGKPNTYLTAAIPSREAAEQFNVSGQLGQALSGVSGIDTQVWAMDKQTRIQGFDSANLPSNFVLKEVGYSRSGIPEFQLYQRAGGDPGEFKETLPEANMVAPTVPDASGLAEKYATSLRQEQETFEREIGERKLASQRARRRVGDRPLLAGETA